MYHIRYNKGSNLAGVECFFFLPSHQLTRDLRAGYDLQDQALVTRELPLAPGANWYQAIVGKHTLQYKGSSRDTRAGRQYDHTLSGIIPKITPEMSAMIRGFDRKKYVVIYQDRNGFLRLIGSKNYGLVFSYEEDSGRVPGDRNQVSFSFSGRSKYPAYFYHGALYDTLAGETEIDFGDVTVQSRVISDGITIRRIEP